MKSLSIVVHGLPVGQPRVRACVRGRHAAVYDPGTANQWKACVIAEARKRMAESLMGSFRGPVHVEMIYWLPRPKSHFGSGKNAGKLKDSAPLRPTGKPDLDNLDKATLDALTNASVWLDDSQVVAKATSKHYGGHGMADIVIREVVE